MNLKILFFTFSFLGMLYVSKAQGIISTIVGNTWTEYIGDGFPATNFALAYPASICLDKNRNIYIADWGNNRIRKLCGDTIITFAGDSIQAFTGDGGPATAAKFRLPAGVCIDTAGNLLITDFGNNAIRKVDITTGIITKVCGTGTAGFGGDNAPAINAFLSQPGCVCTDKHGNIYIPDKANNRIRKINALTGFITTIAGNGTANHTGDGGQASDAQVYYPAYACTDTADNLYFSEHGSNTVRKIDLHTGIITTVAGGKDTTVAYCGDGGPATDAKLNDPLGIFVDKPGNLYIADQLNNVVRMVNPAGIITRIAGTGAFGDTGDGGTALNATFKKPAAIAVDDSGNIFVADYLGAVIRKITPLHEGIHDINTLTFSLVPNPTAGLINIYMPNPVNNYTVSVTDILGKVIYSHYFETMQYNTSIDLRNQCKGNVFVRLSNQFQTIIKKVLIE